MTQVYYETQNEHSYAFCIIIYIINKDFLLILKLYHLMLGDCLAQRHTFTFPVNCYTLKLVRSTSSCSKIRHVCQRCMWMKKENFAKFTEHGLLCRLTKKFSMLCIYIYRVSMYNTNENYE